MNKKRERNSFAFKGKERPFCNRTALVGGLQRQEDLCLVSPVELTSTSPMTPTITIIVVILPNDPDDDDPPEGDNQMSRRWCLNLARLQRWRGSPLCDLLHVCFYSSH